MKLIVGLGNPGPRYAESRHNVGYVVVDELAHRWVTDVTRFDRHFEGLRGEAHAHGQRAFLLKPTTFMNLSGRSVAAVQRYYRLATSDLLIIHDDLDLTVGQLRIRATGSSGGHKGLDDVIRHCGTDEISRLRIGIGKVHRDATTEYVLGPFAPDERPTIEEAITAAADAAECWLQRGVAAAMNQFNRRRNEESIDRPDRDDSSSEGEPC